ncbi:MAG: polyribonucleotide nucleotidyltransferase [Spirochaetota bacterium]|nr:polyribonucleotide nucleotidyltransferase [Spirochaetota bacterium]
MSIERVSFRVGNEDIILETGRMGKQANGFVYAVQGGTAVISSAVAADGKGDAGYFPLMVQYSEKFYAAGKIPGGFIKREGRPKDKEVLISRLIDRPMRPLFPEGYVREVQILPTTVSADGVNPPDVLAMIAAAASVSISDIPFDGPLGSCRVGLIDGKYIINPTMAEIEHSRLNLIVSGTEDAIMMVEGHSENITEDEFLTAMEKAHEAIRVVAAGVRKLVETAGKNKAPFVPVVIDSTLRDEVTGYAREALIKASATPDKLARYAAIDAVAEETKLHFAEAGKPAEALLQVGSILHDLEQQIVRHQIVGEGKRPDGRAFDEIRPITIETSVLPRTHGSALFTRGQTQALVIATLGTALDAQRMDDIDGNREKRFMLHYNFPPFSVGETGRIGAVGRREIGHGMLAERALASVIPGAESFPYVIRVVSEILESNGSSSMASVCGGCLALMDAGVPIKDMVAGVAMGLVMGKDGKYSILADIQGVEDHLGDMDFKLTGTRTGITAFQMDIKVKGITFAIFRDAVEKARTSRLFILDTMQKALSAPRADISPYAPRILTIKINEEKIGAVIGKGGETIRKIQDTTKTVVNVADDGTITVASPNLKDAERALDFIKGLTSEVEMGKVYNGLVKKIMDFGAFIEILPGKDGLCHISKLSEKRVNKVSDVIREGEYIKVRVVDVDRLGRINLSALNTD